MGGIPIEEVRKMKLLQLSWSDHVDYIAVKMGQGVAMTKKRIKKTQRPKWSCKIGSSCSFRTKS